ncbi:DnaD domain protein [Candidatus Phytoplasma oryzae]|nr:hypothetical protein PIE28_02130 [Candidatus Phytoplasma oryzae]
MHLLDQIIIKNQKNLTLEDYKIIILLYLPIIGNDSLNIYQTFYWLSQDHNYSQFEYNYKFLLDFLNIDFENFKNNIDKLEAIGLLNTFQNSGNFRKKIYLIKSPLNSDSFFQDPILSQFLFSTVGSEIYFNLEKIFFPQNNINFANYQNISKKFQDIFSFHKINITKEINKYPIKNNNLDQNFFNNFDFNFFVSELPERFKKPFLFEYKSINYIMKLSFVYGLTPKEMSSVYQEVFRKNFEEALDLNKLRIFLKCKFIKKDCKVQLMSNKNSQNEKDKMIFYLQKTDPYKIINNFVKNREASNNLQNIVFKLVDQNSNIEKGILNSLIMYVCKVKEQEEIAFISYNYFQTILDSWLDQGMISTELAYNFLIEKNSKKIKINKKNNKIRPKWLEDIKRDLSLNNE